MKKKPEKQITTDALARMVQRGFAGMDEKFGDLDKRADERFKLTLDRFEKVEADITDIKRVLGPLVQMMAVNDKQVGNMELRLRRVERKVGISR